MIVKIVTFFLIAMVILGMFGKLRLPKLRDQAKRLTSRKCKRCGRYRIGKGSCDCGQS